MEQFLQLMQSFAGLSLLLRRYSRDQILDMASQLFEVSIDQLETTMITGIGSRQSQMAYGEVIGELMASHDMWGAFHDALYHETSRQSVYGLLKYYILPDRAFLDEVEKLGEPDDTIHWRTAKQFDDIRKGKWEIRHMNPGDGIKVEVGDCLRDLWILFRMLSFLRKDLRYDLRFDGGNGVTFFAYIPDVDCAQVRQKDKQTGLKVASIAKMPGEWSNVQLLKDNGLVPYLLHKCFGCQSTMVGVDQGSYPYLKNYVKGLQMDYLPSGEEAVKYDWIRQHAKDIDILIVNSVYPLNQEITRIYKEERPDGLCYMPLDANSSWMDRIRFTEPGFVQMMERIDVIGTSSKAMQRYLNEKWPWRIECFHNGFFHPWITFDEPDFARKDNVILTVGRLGTQQKATDIMLEAFAVVAAKVPKWKLRLVGGMEEGFQSWLETYFKRHPAVRNRVILVGRIDDKVKLFEEYRKASIFCLTSRWEGGTPNVVAEALHAGCAIATTEFDAHEDATNEGRCGKSAPINNVERVAGMLTSMCRDRQWLKQACEEAYRYAETHYSMEKIVRRIYESLMEEACTR